MTTGVNADHNRELLFVADFYPQLGEYLAEHHVSGYDAGAGRARFLAWLARHADGGEEALADTDADHAYDIANLAAHELAGEDGASQGRGDPGSAADLPAAQVTVDGATTDPIRDYLAQLNKVPRLSVEQEAGLATRIGAGRFAKEKLAEEGSALSVEARLDLEWIADDGRRAENHLLEANLPLVVSLAGRYTGRGVLFLDLIQEGNLGLIRAVEKFDYTKGYKFSTYATWWIRQAITRAMVDQARTIRIPVHMVEVINKFARVQRQMRRALGREPTREELAAELGMTTEWIIELQKYGHERTSPRIRPGEDPPSSHT